MTIDKITDETRRICKFFPHGGMSKITPANIGIKIGKEAFYKQLEMPLYKAYKYTSEVMTKNAMELDAEEGISAFLEKRKPNWKSK